MSIYQKLFKHFENNNNLASQYHHLDNSIFSAKTLRFYSNKIQVCYYTNGAIGVAKNNRFKCPRTKEQDSGCTKVIISHSTETTLFRPRKEFDRNTFGVGKNVLMFVFKLSLWNQTIGCVRTR